MSVSRQDGEKWSAESREDMNNSIEIDTAQNVHSAISKDCPATAPLPSGNRALVLMDLENGLVGWESADDPENPQ